MKLRLLSLCVALGLPAGVAAAPAVHAANPVLGGCVLSGTAKFTPGLTATAKATKFSFTGTFANCQGNGGVTSGKVSASGSGSLGCGNGTGKGSAKVTWNNGKTSSIAFTTTDAGALVAVQGTVKSGVFAGDSAVAELAFQTTTPQACTTTTGLTTASFSGPAEVG